MILPKGFGYLKKWEPKPTNAMLSALENIHVNRATPYWHGIGTFINSAEETFKIVNKLASEYLKKEVNYTLGVIDFSTIKKLVSIPQYRTEILSKDHTLTKIGITYFDYRIIKKFFKSKRRIYYSKNEHCPLYIQYTKEWWFFIAPIIPNEVSFKIVEIKDKVDILSQWF